MQSVFVWGSLVAILFTAAGCGDSCEDLQAICDRCTDADYVDSCNATVTQGNQSLCDARKPNFNADCPYVLGPATTTTSVTTSTSSSGGSGGMTGSGGMAVGGSGVGGAGGAGGSAGAGGV